MADSTPTRTPIRTPPSSNKTNTVASGSSSFQRTLTLYDWWLIKSENNFQGKRLAVAGIASKTSHSSSKLGKGATRVFVSAPVIKRYDVFSLETADGIYIIIKGFLNEQRTLENGFPSEVFNCFLFGFPANWEKYAVHCFREESVTTNDSSCALPDNVPATDQEILCHVEKTTPITSLVSPEDASEDHQKALHDDEMNASKEIAGDDVVCGSSGSFPEDECNASKKVDDVNVVSRRITRSLSMKVCQQKNKPASGFPPKHTDREQLSTSVVMDLENPDGEGLKSPEVLAQSQSLGQVSASSEQLVKESATRISRALSTSTEGSRKEKRVPDKMKVISTNMKNPEVPVQSQSVGEVSASSEQLVKETATRISRALSTSTEGSHKKKRVIDETKAISTNIKRTKSASAVTYPQERDGSPLVKATTDKISSVCRKALSFGRPAGEGLKGPVTRAQSQALGKVNTSSEQHVKNSASGISRSLSRKTEGSYNKKKVTDKTKATTPKIKTTNSASAVKSPQKGNGSPLIKGVTDKNSLVSPISSSLGKSRSGRLLLPRLEFWRNQIPVYNVDREVTEIQDGASLVSPFKGPSPSVNRLSRYCISFFMDELWSRE
ncbi:PREDICTED: uncharacterized protein LOC109327089 isoform X2 [Lupinus angustifolius]|uniref:uncharacterized protein LOC109327089 isoform X2 n=1 Tax=Lupinus angustifolius TaxID=3871 RepID=UPI00092EBB84|nr:PREDICTED: uncharacterized protein LOC109327089 isoform X2 [Lupinus angustifolius]